MSRLQSDPAYEFLAFDRAEHESLMAEAPREPGFASTSASFSSAPAHPHHLQMLVAFVFGFVCFYADSINQVLVERASFHRGFQSRASIHDLGFNALPKIDAEVPKVLLSVFAVLTLARIAYLRGQHKLQIALRRFFLIAGFLFLLRSITIGMTQLPNPLLACRSTVNNGGFFLIDALLVQFDLKTTCSDVLFSGHAVAATLLALFWHMSGEDRPFNNAMTECSFASFIAFISTIFGWIILGVILVCLVSSRMHYSDDVIIGTVLSMLVFALYHTHLEYLDQETHKHRDIDSSFQREFPNFLRVGHVREAAANRRARNRVSFLWDAFIWIESCCEQH